MHHNKRLSAAKIKTKQKQTNKKQINKLFWRGLQREIREICDEVHTGNIGGTQIFAEFLKHSQTKLVKWTVWC